MQHVVHDVLQPIMWAIHQRHAARLQFGTKGGWQVVVLHVQVCIERGHYAMFKRDSLDVASDLEA